MFNDTPYSILAPPTLVGSMIALKYFELYSLCEVDFVNFKIGLSLQLSFVPIFDKQSTSFESNLISIFVLFN